MAVQLSLPMPTPGVTSEDEARVVAYVANIMPRGVPTYVRRVLNVNSDRYGFVARIELFDGGLCDVTITGPLGGAGYSWYSRTVARPSAGMSAGGSGSATSS